MNEQELNRKLREYKRELVERIGREFKEAICSNCKLQVMAVCEACQIDFEEARQAMIKIV